MPANLKSSAGITGVEKSVFIPIPKKVSAKECSSTFTITLISHASNILLKILQDSLQQYMNCELSDVQAEKAEEPDIKLPTSAGSSKKQESSRKTSISASLTIPKPLTVWIIKTVENSKNDGNTRPSDLPLEKPVCRSGSNS